MEKQKTDKISSMVINLCEEKALSGVFFEKERQLIMLQ